MRIITGQEFVTSGTVRVDGQNPVENDAVLRRMSFVKESQLYPDIKVKRVLEAASWFYPNWDAELAAQLMEDFDLPTNRAVKKLSRGMHSAVGIVIGLAARAEITLFDEPYLGLDAVARQIFYDRLLADYAEHPRTILLSTHLIDEVANLLEHVVVINQGRIVVDARPTSCAAGRSSVSGAASAPSTSSSRTGGAQPAGHRLPGLGDRQRPARRPRPGPGPGDEPADRAGVAAGIRGAHRGRFDAHRRTERISA